MLLTVNLIEGRLSRKWPNVHFKQIQRVLVQCDCCEKQWECRYCEYLSMNESNNSRDLCRSCKQKEMYSLGLRTVSEKSIGQLRKCAAFMRGKTFDELYGKEKADEMKLKIIPFNDEQRKKSNETNKRKYSGVSYDEKYGKEKADEIRMLMSIKASGENNPMFGKPAPYGSGNGWSGWFIDSSGRKTFFRSLKELSYIVNILEKSRVHWKSAEDIKIPYIHPFEKRKATYHPDFIVNSNVLVEIKPLNLAKSPIIITKAAAAEAYCEEQKLEYKLITDNMFQHLDIDTFRTLISENKVIPTKRTLEKMLKWIKK